MEHKEVHRIVKFENIEPNLGEGGDVETDVFIITAQGGSDKVKVTTKAGSEESGGGYAYSTLHGVGDSVVDGLGFTITLVSITTDPGGDVLEYNITVTSDAVSGGDGSPSLSHVSFDFGKYCPVEINAGATVAAYVWDVWHEDPLEATTDGITIIIDEDGDIASPATFPYSTLWAWACCDVS